MGGIKNRRAVLLIIAILCMSVISALTGIYLSRIVTEKRSVDDERLVIQAVNLAESGANHAVAELRRRMNLDLKANVQAKTQSSYFYGYVSSNNPLGFLRDNCGAAGADRFTITGNEAVLEVDPIDIGAEGGAAARIRISAPQPPVADWVNEEFSFYYSYTIESTGSVTRYAEPISKQVIFSPKAFTISIRRGNFAKFSLFTAHHKTTNNTTVWFTSNTNFNGPVHTNDRFCFAGRPSAHFTEDTTQHLSKAYFFNEGNSVLLNNDHNGTHDVPEFDKGFERSADEITLTSSLTQADLKNQALGGIAEPGNGICVPNDGTSLVGGIYIRGNQGQSSDNASINMTVDGSNRQVYTISQAAATVTVTVDAAHNQTIVTNGAGTSTYAGMPNGLGDEGILIYVNDDIKSLSGTVQADTQATIASERDIVITNNVTYQNYSASPLNAAGCTNLLGILSWGGNVRIGAGAPDNVSIHGVVMAPHGVFTVDNYDDGVARGTATLLGGVITDYYGAFGTFGGFWGDTGYGRNFVYDARMLEGMAPPYFPYMANFEPFLDPSDVLMQRLIWQVKD